MHKLVLSIGSHDYTRTPGGASKAIGDHQRMLNEQGYDYLFICPLELNKLSSFVSTEKDWIVLFNGQASKVKHFESLLQWIKAEHGLAGVHIHHLVRERLDQLTQLLTAALAPVISFIVHDFYAFCRYFTQVPVCRALEEKDIGQACAQCEMRAQYYAADEYRALFQKIGNKLRCIAPSESAAADWKRAYPALADTVTVVPHEKLLGEYSSASKKADEEQKLKVVFVGSQASNKGWDHWQRIIEEQIGSDRIAYYHAGNGTYQHPSLQRMHASFHQEGRDMVSTLRKLNPDAAILLSNWHETYSYTYFECLAANAFVITCQQSGNIAAQVACRHNGIVLDNPEDLAGSLSNPDLLANLIKTFRDKHMPGPATLVPNNEIIPCITAQPIRHDYDISVLNRLSGHERRMTAANNAYKALQRFLYKGKGA